MPGAASANAKPHTNAPQPKSNAPPHASAASHTSLSAKIQAKKKQRENLIPHVESSGALTDEEFRTTIEQLSKVLTLEDVHWEKHVEALQLLSTLMMYDKTAERKNFLTVIGSFGMKQALLKQLSDLRSSVVREACRCVRSFCMACRTRPDIWVNMCDWYVPSLLQCRSQTVAAISQAAEETLVIIAERAVVNRNFLLHLTQGCVGRHGGLRSHCFRYLVTMLCRTTDSASLRRYVEMLAQVIREGLFDAGEDCRRYARLSFWALERLEQDAMLAFYESLDEATQVKLDDEKAKFNRLLKQHLIIVQEEQKLMKPSTNASTAQDTESTQGEAAAPVVRSGGDNAVTPSRSPLQPAGLRATGKRNTPLRTRSPAARGKEGYAVEFSAKKRSLHAAESVGGAPSASIYVPSVNFSESAAGTPASSGALTRSTPTSRLLARGSNVSERWHSIVTSTQSTDWSSRVQGLTEVGRLLDSSKEDGGEGSWLTKQHTNEILGILVFRLADPHYRVAIAAAGCFDSMLTHYPSLVLESLHDFLPVFFAHLQHVKEPLRNIARVELQALASLFDSDVLMSPIYRVLDQMHNNAKVKTLTLEYLLYLIQKSPASFSHGAVRSTLGRLMLHFGREKNDTTDVARAISACVCALYQVNADALIRTVIVLPQQEQHAIFRAAEIFVPHLQQDCRRAAAGERLLHHAEVNVPSPFEKALRESSPSGKLEAILTNTPQGALSRMGQAHGGAHGGGQHGASTGKWSPQGDRSSSKALFADVSALTATKEESRKSAHAAQHYDPEQFHASASRNADVFLREGMMSPKERVKAQVASRIYEAVNEHRLPPDIVLQLRQGVDSESRRSALVLATIGVTERRQQWVEHFPELMGFVVSLSSDGDHSVRLAALRCIEATVKSEDLQPFLSKILQVVLDAILKAMDDPFPEVQREAAVVFHVACSGCFFGTEHLVKALLHCVANRSPAAHKCYLQTIEEVGRVLWRGASQAKKGVSSSEWLGDETLVSLVAQMTALFGHEMSEVRKTVVGVFVNIWAALGERCFEHLKPLAISQKKLISIYFQRHCVENGLASAQDPPRDLGREIEHYCGKSSSSLP